MNKSSFLKVSFIAIVLLNGCSTVTYDHDPDYFSRLWKNYKTQNALDNPQVFKEYKVQKKEKRQNFHEYITKSNDDDPVKKLLLGWIDSSAFVVTKALVPLYSDQMFATPIYLIEDYSFEIPLGEHH